MARNIAKFIFKQIKILIVLFTVSIALLLNLPLFLLVLLIRSVVWVISKVLRPDLDGFVSHVHSFFTVDRPTKAALNVVIAAVLDGHLTSARLKQLLDERIFSIKDSQGKLVYSRLKQHWTSFLGFAFWRTDPNFDLGHHVRDYDYTGSLSCPSPCTEEDLKGLFSGLIEREWKEGQSPWEYLLVHNYCNEDKDRLSGGKTVLVFRFDHILGDGYSVVELTKTVGDSLFTLPQVRAGLKVFSPLQRIGLLLKLPYDTAENLLVILESWRLRQNPKSKGGVLCSVSSNVPMELVKRIKDHYGVGFASVLYAGIQGGIQRTMEERGQVAPSKLASAYVVPRSGHPPGMSFNTSLVFSKMCCKTESPVERLLKIDKVMKGLSRSTASILFMNLGLLAQYFPICVRRWNLNIMMEFGPTFGTTHFPCTTSKDYFDGHPMVDMFTVVGTFSSIGMVASTFGVNQNLRFNFTVDKRLFKTEEMALALGECVDKELQNLATSTT